MTENIRRKVIVTGAAGNLGRRLVTRGLAHGHEITAFVRSAGRFAEHWGGPLPGGVKVVEGDVRDAAGLGAAVAGHDALVNAAGHATEGQDFVTLFDAVVSVADTHLPPAARLWMVAGAAALTVPHTSRLGVDLPGMPAIYKTHETNWRRLQAARHDWALMCPGPMTAAGDGRPRGDLRVSIEVSPLEIGAWARWAPAIALSLAMKRRLPELIVSYEDVAEIIMTHLASGDRFSRQRVGVALPPNEQGSKSGWTPGQRGPNS